MAKREILICLIDGFLSGLAIPTWTARRQENFKICDNYVLTQSNNTQIPLKDILLDSKYPAILSHSFNTKLIRQSHCVNIIGCMLPRSPQHKELLAAMEMERSLTWKMVSCSQDRFQPTNPNQQSKLVLSQGTVTLVKLHMAS